MQWITSKTWKNSKNMNWKPSNWVIDSERNVSKPLSTSVLCQAHLSQSGTHDFLPAVLRGGLGNKEPVCSRRQRRHQGQISAQQTHALISITDLHLQYNDL